MIVVWSAITIESLVNHAIAESSEDKKSAIRNIEHPPKFNHFKEAKSDLARKLLVLCKEEISDASILKAANHRTKLRNNIVHDKPIEYLNRNFDDLEIIPYSKRGNPENKIVYFEQLHGFYTMCHEVCLFEKNTFS